MAAFAAKRQASKAEVMKQTRLAQEEKRLLRKGDGKGGNKEKKRKGSPLGNPEEKGYQSADGAGGLGERPFSATMFSNAPHQKFGDLFPLPLPRDHGFLGCLAALGSGRSRQRVHRRRVFTCSGV